MTYKYRKIINTPYIKKGPHPSIGYGPLIAAVRRYDTTELDDSLLEHSLSDLHEAGNVGTLDIVNMTVCLCTELNASLVDALHDEVQLVVNFLCGPADV